MNATQLYDKHIPHWRCCGEIRIDYIAAIKMAFRHHGHTINPYALSGGMYCVGPHILTADALLDYAERLMAADRILTFEDCINVIR